MRDASLLIIIGEPFEERHVQDIFGRIFEGLSCLDQERDGVDWNTELLNFVNKNVPPENPEQGGSLLRLEGKVYIEVLLAPPFSLLELSLHNLVTSRSTTKHIVHAGPALAGNGDWFLSNAFFALADLGRIINSADCVLALKEVCPGSRISLSCISDGRWNDAGVKQYGLDQNAEFLINPDKKEPALPCLSDVCSYLSQFAKNAATDLGELMRETAVVGNVKFDRPTFYVFPGGQGDSALFGISGFTMLIDGGFGRRASYWDFVRHLDRVDTLLISRLTPDTVFSTSNFLRRKVQDPQCHPHLGCVFANLPPKATQNPKHPLSVSVLQEAASIADSLSSLNLKIYPASLSLTPKKLPEVVTLYQKVGQGRLDLYVLNPGKDSREMKEFLDHWKKAANGAVLGATKGGVSLAALNSVSALIVWRPANASEQITKILYPGVCPQDKLFSVLEKMRTLDFMKVSSAHKSAVAAVRKSIGKKQPPPAVPSKPPAGPPIPEARLNAGRETGSAVVPAEPDAEVKAESSEEIQLPPSGSASPAVVQQFSPASPISPAVGEVELCEKPGSNANTALVEVESVTECQLKEESNELEKNFEDGGLEPTDQPEMEEEINDYGSRQSFESGPTATQELDDQQFFGGAEGSPERLNVTEKSNEIAKGSAEEEEVGDDVDLMRESENLVNQSPGPVQNLGATRTSPKDDLLNGFGQEPVSFPTTELYCREEADFGVAPTDPGRDVKNDEIGFNDAGMKGADNPAFESPESLDNPASERVFREPTEFTKSDHFGLPESPISLNTPEAPTVNKEESVDTRETGGTYAAKDRWMESPEHNFKGEMDILNSVAPDEPIPGLIEDRHTDLTEVFHRMNLNDQPLLGYVGPQSGIVEGFNRNEAAAAATTEHPSPPSDSVPGAASGVSSPLSHPKPTLEELQKAWGEPLSLPPPVSASSGAPKTRKPAPAPRRQAASSTSKTSSTPEPKTTGGESSKKGSVTKVRGPPPSRSSGLGRSGGNNLKHPPPAQKKSPPALGGPVELDVVYIPDSGKNHSVDADFFRLIRSKNYVWSTVHPTTDVLDALLAGKKAWGQPSVETTLIPTYDSQSLHLWMALKQEEIEEEGIRVAPSASRCQVNMERLDSGGDTCAAYRLEL